MNDDEIIAAVRAGSGILPAPASPAAVAEAEQIIGYPLPTLLRRLYLEVANGEFGPGENVLGIQGARGDRQWTDIIDVYQAFGSNPDDPPPPCLVWLHDWGCAIWSLVDCRDPSGPMLSLIHI